MGLDGWRRKQRPMVQVEYRRETRAAELTGHTVAEVRRLFEGELGFGKQTAAVLNGVRVSTHREGCTTLNDDDNLVFKAVSHRVAFLLGALLLVLAITGGVFASGFMNGSASLSGATVANNNFAEISVNGTVSTTWDVLGGVKGSTGNATLFNVDTASSGYTGDLVLTVSLANEDTLSTIYRSLSLSIELRDSLGNLVDINEDNNAGSDDYALLTLNNGSVTLPFEQTAAQVYTVWLKNGSFIAQVYSSNWNNGEATPMFFCEVAQR
jgi:hypothetical protein